MHVVIIGAGEVGTSIADSLDGSHDVVVIDVDEARAEELTYELDVMTLAGDGTSPSVLEEAGIGAADMLIASTDDDETNLVACDTARTLADPFTVARIKSVEYLRTWELTEPAPSRRPCEAAPGRPADPVAASPRSLSFTHGLSKLFEQFGVMFGKDSISVSNSSILLCTR